jgi:hypothetical protein
MKESDKASARRRIMIERGKAVRAQCGGCGHPRKEHRDRILCTVPKCACTGYFLMELASQ